MLVPIANCIIHHTYKPYRLLLCLPASSGWASQNDLLSLRSQLSLACQLKRATFCQMVGHCQLTC